MRAKSVKNMIKETGAGYAVWGGGSRGGFGNPSQGGIVGGRGFGFGSSNNSGGPNMMYTYDIKPLNKTLEPRGSEQVHEPIVHMGTIIKGKVLGKEKHVIGQVIEVKKDHDNNIQYYLVLDPDTSLKVKVDPTSSYVWESEPEGGTPVGQDYVKNENLIESVDNFENDL